MKKIISAGLVGLFVVTVVFSSAELLSAQSPSSSSPIPGFTVPTTSPVQDIGDIDPEIEGSGCILLTSTNLRYRSTDARTGGEVSLLQDFLQSRGYLNSEPTGFFGLQTLAAVKSFQKASGFEATGYVGPLTKGEIKKLTCEKSEIDSRTIQIISPSGNEVFRVGDTVLLEWKTTSSEDVPGPQSSSSYSNLQPSLPPYSPVYSVVSLRKKGDPYFGLHLFSGYSTSFKWNFRWNIDGNLAKYNGEYYYLNIQAFSTSNTTGKDRLLAETHSNSFQIFPSATVVEKPNLEVTAGVGQSDYTYGDTIHFGLKVYNPTANPQILTFPNSCQVSYEILEVGTGKSIYNSDKGRACAMVIAQVTIPAYGSYTWNETRPTSVYEALLVGGERYEILMSLNNSGTTPLRAKTGVFVVKTGTSTNSLFSTYLWTDKAVYSGTEKINWYAKFSDVTRGGPVTPGEGGEVLAMLVGADGKEYGFRLMKYNPQTAYYEWQDEAGPLRVGTWTIYAVARKNGQQVAVSNKASYEVVKDSTSALIIVSSPKAGDVLTTGQTYTVAWTGSGIDDVRQIQFWRSKRADFNNFSADAGVTTIADTLVSSLPQTTAYHMPSAPLASSGTFSWKVNDICGDCYPYNKIRILGMKGNTSVLGVSGTFSIHPFSSEDSNSGFSVTVLSPNGGENFSAGSAQRGNWVTSIPVESRLTIRLRGENDQREYPLYGAVGQETALNSVVNDGSELVIIPTNLPDQGYRVEVKTSYNGQSALDASDSYFKIASPTIQGQLSSIGAVSPSAGKVFTVGETSRIEWRASNLETVDIFLSIPSSPGSERVIASGVNAAQGYYVWTVPSLEYGTGLYQIKLVGNAPGGKSYLAYTGNVSFATSYPSVTVVSPNGGEKFAKGGQVSVTWKSRDIPSTSTVTIYARSHGMGDIDGDGTVTTEDSRILQLRYNTKLGEQTYYPRADLNRDGVVSIADSLTLAENMNKSSDIFLGSISNTGTWTGSLAPVSYVGSARIYIKATIPGGSVRDLSDGDFFIEAPASVSVVPQDDLLTNIANALSAAQALIDSLGGR